MKLHEFKKNFTRRKNAWIPRQTKGAGGKGPNATEEKYLREILNAGYNDGKHLISYQPQPIIITSTNRREYTADFLVTPTINLGERTTYHEVKGSYHLPTHERARLAWEIAAEKHPESDFVWAELKRTGWEIERWEFGGRRILVHLATDARGVFNIVEADWRRHRTRSSTRNRKGR